MKRERIAITSLFRLPLNIKQYLLVFDRIGVIEKYGLVEKVSAPSWSSKYTEYFLNENDYVNASAISALRAI